MRLRPVTRTPLGLSLAAAAALGIAATQVAPATGAPPGDPGALRSGDQGGTVSLVHVNAPTPALRTKVDRLGLDTTEHADSSGVSVVLHGAADAKVLRDAGFTWRTTIPDLGARMRANAAKDRAYAAANAESPLPSGRTSYRHLSDYNAEMTLLAQRFPNLVKPLTLKNKSVEGREVRGIEITTNATRVDDGKPVFLVMGAHHAREWPSSEHSMEFAYDLLENFRTSDRARAILQNVRVIVVPVVNVDGFEISREAAPKGDFSQFDYEMKRKNCTVSVNTPPAYQGGTCVNNPAGRLRGTDLNRNYPGFWGGGGASPTWSSDTYRGDGPGSEPESDNIRALISGRQVTNLITNHTFSNLVLRPPSIAATGLSPDEPTYRALGEAMTNANGYSNWASYQLYDTSGSVEDWSYWNTGGFGFTFEIGPDEFHPPFQTGVVAEYLGLSPAQGAGYGGNREAYYLMAEATIDKSKHSTIAGTTQKGRTLSVSKTFISATSPVIGTDGTVGPPRYYQDTLTSRLVPDKTGRFSWAVNPSTRPLVVGRYGRDPVGPAEPAKPVANPAGVPAVGQSETSSFSITGAPTYDNGKATLNFSWPGGTAVDWDFYVYDSRGRLAAQAATAANPEAATLIDPVPGTYTVVAVNYDGGTTTTDWTGAVSFSSPTPGTYSGLKESWTLTCSAANGKVLKSQMVTVDRGQTANVGDPCTKSRKR
ncbi:M14 family zinc carboxypeptidase [Luteipulveratus sp. YIM 133132]|uniref:M14 family zinc carboxypeptidase n=1 Tax=Luteipulveratus flavus TaxID=3031728 RepID=UPI0023AF3986|nr:M14 family zinc carboxypeptidase [Luteipulveratus sp. YIM 133132]MDE9367019.1 M14 family zinc carboxypeptidase [Luteipulveratus sp. YIM 133132]